MQRTKTGKDESRRDEPATVLVSGRHQPLSRAAIGRAISTVLASERRRANLSVTFVGPTRMRKLNSVWKGRDATTDVLAFALRAPGKPLQGDVYICRAVAVREARAWRSSIRQELLRLVVHGTLHVLGYDHPEDERRTASAMWRKQERYLRCLG